MAHDFLHKLTGSFAKPAGENPTVVMIEAAYRHHGLDWRYINCEVAPEALGDAVRGALAMGWMGFNCSLPHKVEVIKHLDGLGSSAEIIGAVNTVVRRGEKLIGENTDGKGFVAALRDVTEPEGKRVALFGAGGAARAAAVELALAGAARIDIVNRGRERGETLARLVAQMTPAASRYLPWVEAFRVAEDVDIVVNATSIGLYPDVDATLDIDLATLRPGMVVADVIPNPPETRLLRAARAAGCTALDGLGMLVNQGVIAIKYWTGVDADASVMRMAILDLGL